MLALAPWAVAVLAVAVSVYAVSYGLRERRRRKGRPLWDRSPVPLRPLRQIDSLFAAGPLGYAPETAAVVIGDPGDLATTSESEAWILGVLARRAKRIFEFGTCTGRTAYLLARNAPDNAEVITITLSPETAAQYQADGDDPESARWESIARCESVHARFFYEGTDAAGKIRQLFGDSKEFDTGNLAGICDLVFIDGSHAYSYVASDSEKAFAMVAPDGFIVWHDFSPACPGVWRYLNEAGRNHNLFHIKGTRLVLYRHPAQP